MKRLNEKGKMVVSVVVLFVIVFALIGFNSRGRDDNNFVYNRNGSFLRKQVVKNVTFSNIECYYDGANSLISYIISNQTNKKIYMGKYKILVKAKDGSLITSIVVDFSQSIKAKQKIEYRNQVVGVDLSDAYSMEIVSKK